MKTNNKNKLLYWSVFWIIASFLVSDKAFSQNIALEFDGDYDYITLAPINGMTPSGSFTLEMWFYCSSTGGNANCLNSFRRLFSIGDNSGTNYFDVGECAGNIMAFGTATGIISPFPSINIRDNKWHCISLVRSVSPNELTIYLNGIAIPALTGINPGTGFVFDKLVLGHWSAPFLLDPDWKGYIDELKIWNTALPVNQLTSCYHCSLSGHESNLIAYWRFDDGIPNGNNNLPLPISSVADLSFNGNKGQLYLGGFGGFLLTPNSHSNFVLSTSPVLYPEYHNMHIQLTQPANGTAVSGICDGDPVHFSIVNASGQPASGNVLASVDWYYSDDCITWTPLVAISPASAPSALFNGFSFVSPPGHTALNCGNSLNGFVDRCYRAIITVNDGTKSCTYVAQSGALRICCKVQSAALNVTPDILPVNGSYCEGQTVNFQSTITGIPVPASTNNYMVNWIWSTPTGNTTLTSFANQLTSNYTATLTLPASQTVGTYCLIATVSNCICPPITLKQCYNVDKMPSCGTITGATLPPNLMPDPDGNPDHYIICPGSDAALQFASNFTNCTPQWQYMFPGGIWMDLGSTNSTQNTNTLPHLMPAGSPYLWPANVDRIFYRVKCLPLSYPNSGCQPCYSNVLQIRLKTPPSKPSFSVAPAVVCKGTPMTLSVISPDPNCNYEWYSGGLLVGSGSVLNNVYGGCIYVCCNDGCFITCSDKNCLDVCDVIAIAGCNDPICPYEGDKITLDASLSSYSTCGNPLMYTWSWVDQNGATQTSIGPVLMDVPSTGGTNYTLTVTDNLGCSNSTTINIDPCNKP